MAQKNRFTSSWGVFSAPVDHLRSHRKTWLSLLVGILISVVFVHLLMRGVPWKGVREAFLHIDWFWCLPAVLLYVGGHILRGLRCAWIMRPYKKISTYDATQVVWIGYAANNLLPARLGEVVRAYVMAKREEIPKGITMSTLFVERLLDGLAIVGILWGVSLFAPSYPWIQEIGWIAGGIFLAALVVMLAARFWRDWFARCLSWGAGLLPTRVGSILEGFGLRLLEGLACLRWDRYLLGILSLSMLVWIVEGAMFWALLPAFGLPASLITAYLAMSITNLGVLVPSTPGHVGTFHFFCSKALLATSVASTAAVGLAYATVVHALQFVSVTLLGMWAMYSYGLNLRALWGVGNQPQHENEPPGHQGLLPRVGQP